jgi:hypothetical protein
VTKTFVTATISHPSPPVRLALLLFLFASMVASPGRTNEPTLGEYSVVYDHYADIPMEWGYILTDAPSLAKTSDGALLCAVPLMIRGEPRHPVRPLLFFRSGDGGRTWAKLPAESDFCAGTLFQYDGMLYFLGTGPVHRRGSNMGIIRSEDNGRTWSDPVTLFEGNFYNPATSYVVRGVQFYWCMDEGREGTYVIAGDLSKGLLDAASWRISDPLPIPELPRSLTRRKGDGKILEGNVVEVGGRLQVCWRYMIDDRDSVGIGVICDLDDDGRRLDYRFRQFHALPGAQNQFHIVHDDVSRLYWMNATLPTRSQDQDPAFNAQLRNNPRYSGPAGKERRILALYCSFDALNWLPAGYIVVWPLVRQASNYCGLLIDGDDLLVVARTSRDGRNQHDNDLTTFHRIKNFRERAAPLMPAQE